MKKIISTIITFTLLFVMQFQAYAAVGWPTYTVESNVSAERGDTITVPITVSNNPGFTSVGFIVRYNRDVLDIVSVTHVTASMPLNSQFALTSTPGSQWIHLINTNLTDWSGNGVVVYITFKVKPNAAVGSSPVSLSFTGTPDGTPANSSGTILRDARIVSGSVYVSDASSESISPPSDNYYPEATYSQETTGGKSIAEGTGTSTPEPVFEATPESEPKKSTSQDGWLPQTGQLYWPIPILAVFAVLTLIPCSLLLRKKKNET